VLAAPREAGTPEAEAARELVAAHLTALGYTVERQPVRWSPATLWAFPLLGAGLGWLSLVLLPLLGMPGLPPWAALGAWMIGALSLATVVAGVGAGWAQLPFVGAPRQDANLIATRSPRVHRWIVAHLDSKAQAHSMAGRLVAVWVVVVAALGLTALCLARLRGPVPLWSSGAGAGLAVAAGFLAGRGRLSGRSRGALDNGSGLLAALVAAEVTQDPNTGILITAAEEFGLVGARAFARERPSLLIDAQVINLDTIDDAGTLYIVSHDSHGGPVAVELADRLGRLGLALRRRRLPLGIFVDSHPLARGGAAAITIGRLNWRTLGVLHTARDVPEGRSFETAERIGRIIAA
jgi:hypothetical protein